MSDNFMKRQFRESESQQDFCMLSEIFDSEILASCRVITYVCRT